MVLIVAFPTFGNLPSSAITHTQYALKQDIDVIRLDASAGERMAYASKRSQKKSEKNKARPEVKPSDPHAKNSENFSSVQEKALSDSSLAASWAAVDAARKANEISSRVIKWNIIGVVILVLTLLSTAWAAIAASRSTSIAQSLVDGIDRPYLIVQFVDANFSGIEAPQDFLAVRFRIKNIGGSPAIIDTFSESLAFEYPEWNKDLRENLGGSNIYVIEKGGSTPDFVVSVAVTQINFRTMLLNENKHLTWRVNFSYTDLLDRRRNYYFEEFYFQPPFGGFRSNLPPRVVEVPLDPHKWFRRKNFLRSWFYSLKYKLFPSTKPKMV